MEGLNRHETSGFEQILRNIWVGYTLLAQGRVYPGGGPGTG